MSWQSGWNALLRQPVGVSFVNGTGTSGIFCGVQGNEIFILEYLYQDQFATKHYPISSIRRLLPFPDCIPLGVQPPVPTPLPWPPLPPFPPIGQPQPRYEDASFFPYYYG
ncbi:hypothetical protein D3C73_1312530 [compost metagenome]